MPRVRINMSVTQKGPIFDAAVSKAAGRRMVIAINDAIAREGVHRALVYLGSVLRNPTGYYESNIRVERRAIQRTVTDNDVVYGGWLEGIDSRNRTTRFKGYWTFRKMKQSLERDKVKLAQPYVYRFVREMGGTI